MAAAARPAPALHVAAWRSICATLLLLAGCAVALGVRAAEPSRAEAFQRAADATVGVLAVAVQDARSAETLGTRRAGSGVLIGADGLVLTIGYLVLEADRVDLVVDGKRLPARVVAYDLASGFGLLQALTPLRVAPAPLGAARGLEAGAPLVVVSGGDAGAASLAQLIERRPFSGYWEYHIDGALFTAPARRDHSGAGLFNADGELVGIGSLVVADVFGGSRPRMPGNMFVPVDLLAPILGELRERGVSGASRRAWIGVNCLENDGAVEVVRVNRGSPAEEAGIEPGDRIVGVDGVPVAGLEAFYKALWRDAFARPDRDVEIAVRRGGELLELTVHAVDRNTMLRRAQGI